MIFLAAFAGGMLLAQLASAAPPPPRAEQPRPDIFQVVGVSNLQVFNPVTVKAKAERGARYRLLVLPGCSAGTIPADLVRLEQHMREQVQFDLVRNDSVYDFTIRINCGTTQIAVCGSINVFCLGRGFPQKPDVDISDVLSLWQPETRLAILAHETSGHAIGTWNEQYALCGRSCGFAASPGWRDFMNTGPESRHGFEAIELERWARTMYELTPPSPWGACSATRWVCWNTAEQRWIAGDAWRWDPATGTAVAHVCATSWCGQWTGRVWLAGDGATWVEGAWYRHPFWAG
jgi:hypothetical protein